MSGKKDLVLDPELMKALDRVAGATLLKVCIKLSTDTDGLLQTLCVLQESARSQLVHKYVFNRDDLQRTNRQSFKISLYFMPNWTFFC